MTLPHLLDPDWLTTESPHARYAELRAREPVSRQVSPEADAYWAVLRHADVMAVAKNPALFSCARGGILLADDETQLPTLLSLDPPRHTEMRRRVLHAFAPRVSRRLEARMRDIVRETFARAPDGEPVDFARDIVRPLPLHIVCDVLGVPESDRARVGEWADRLAGADDPDFSAGGRGGSEGAIEFGRYAFELAQQHETRGGDDLLSVLLNAELDGEQVDLPTFCGLFVQIAIAGNETTRSTLCGGMAALLAHPEQYARLEADARAIPNAVEEMLRFLSPVRYFRRTATASTVLGDARIEAGERVVMLYASANRDERVFEDPQRFDVRRRPNPHLAFGFGEHFCLGAALARMEARIFLEEFFRAFRGLRAAGDFAWLRSSELSAIKRMPVRLQKR